MGLGKTVQTLAHLLLEKAAGPPTEPALIVAPDQPDGQLASAERRASRRLKCCRCTARAQGAFGADPRSTWSSPPIRCWRCDQRECCWRSELHVVILDEAQMIKNPQRQGRAGRSRAPARHRLCLTGTPLENHLGELWSLFDFLLPGLLGDRSAAFSAAIARRSRRTAIARARSRSERGASRPFLLRRTKEESQRSCRRRPRSSSRRARARRSATSTRACAWPCTDGCARRSPSKGLARSQIIILDALLKLRQVCCDPRLVEAREPRKSAMPSAKLERLTEMLPELIAEGRRVLVFSQFTSMLRSDRGGCGRSRHRLCAADRRHAATATRWSTEFQAGKVPCS